MSRSTRFITAVALSSGAALNLHLAQSAYAMTIKWDCFDRSSNALIARSAIDITSPAISCLQAAGDLQLTDTATDESPEIMDISNENHAEDDLDHSWNDDEFTEESFTDDELAEQNQSSDQSEIPSTGDALGAAVGNHLGKLLGQGISDLFR
ncbi:MAG: hypothetical protein VYE46_08430 [Cyanobacteriota bacterium]|nr:hypothetical protein [Cyanobacteriota bacterium]